MNVQVVELCQHHHVHTDQPCSELSQVLFKDVESLTFFKQFSDMGVFMSVYLFCFVFASMCFVFVFFLLGAMGYYVLKMNNKKNNKNIFAVFSLYSVESSHGKEETGVSKLWLLM